MVLRCPRGYGDVRDPAEPILEKVAFGVASEDLNLEATPCFCIVTSHRLMAFIATNFPVAHSMQGSTQAWPDYDTSQYELAHPQY